MRIFAALLTRITNSGKTFQGSYLGKTKSGIRNLSPYGFFSYPPSNSKLVVIQDAFEGFYAIGYKNDVIPSLEEDEAVIGNFVKGTTIKFDKDGNIDITCVGNKTVTVAGNCTINVTGDASIDAENINATANTKATITAPTTDVVATTAVNITSPLTTITGALTVTGTTILETKPFLTHVHLAGTPPGNTGVVV